jgi:iron complex outermembrane receptor protein
MPLNAVCQLLKPSSLSGVSRLRAVTLTVLLAPVILATPAFGSDDLAASTTGDDGSRLSEVVVSAQTYQQSTATKTDTPVLEVPQSVSVISRIQLDEQAPQSINEALRYSAGVVPESEGTASDFWGASSIQMRGFAAGIYFDGLQNDTFGNDLLDPYFYQSITILSGPASVLFGQASPGGIVNVQTKLPTATPLHEFLAGFGNYDRYQVGIDIGGPLDADGQYLYRVTAVGLSQNTQMQFVRHERIGVAPAFTWRPSESTTITLLANFTLNPAVGDYADLPAVGTALPDPLGRIPTSFFLGDPTFNQTRQELFYIGYQLDHRFNDTWDFQQSARFNDNKNWADMMWPLGLEADNESLDRYAFTRHEASRSFLIDNRLITHFELGGLRNDVLIGLNFSRFLENWTWGDNEDVPPINVFNPVYFLDITAPALTGSETVNAHQTGVYAQDQLSLDHWRFLVGARHDWVHEIDTYDDARSLEQDRQFTYRAGLVYLFDSGLAPYASYSTSFQPQFGNTESGTPFVPTMGKQYEAGLKFQPAGASSFISAAIYNLTEQNVLTTDPENPNFQVQVGEIRSRGAELSGHLGLTESLSLLASYTYLDSRYTKSDTFDTGINDVLRPTQGMQQFAVPEHMASLWAEYAFHTGPRGLSLSAGARYTGSSYGDDVDSFSVPAFTLFDVGARYDLGELKAALRGLRLQLNASNLLDKTYVSSCSYGSCNYGVRRVLYGSVTYDW